MRHAFLIIAHNNWEQLKKLIECLDSDNHDIYVHIDKKSREYDESFFENTTKKSNLKIYRKYEVYWGGFSQVQVEIFLFQMSHHEHYDYYHLISGADLPLKNNKEIDAFFEDHKGNEFILYDDMALNQNSEITRRTKYYHFLQNYRRKYKQKWKNDIFTFFERVLLVCQIIIRIDRTKNLDWKIKYGSQWVSITHELVSVILENKNKITRVFSCTNCADELFIQTIAYNCGFKQKIYQPDLNQTANLRYIDWNRGNNGNPYTFKFCDKNLLIPSDSKENKNLFARKFSESIDKSIINEVLMNIKNERK